jgi:hypothetical protein
MRAQIFASALFLWPMPPVNADSPLAIAVSPLQSIAPATVVVRVHISPNVANRALEVVAQSDDFYRSSRIQLDGDDAPTGNSLEFRSLPGGDYEVRATLIDSTGNRRASARAHVIVIPSGGGD